MWFSSRVWTSELMRFRGSDGGSRFDYVGADCCWKSGVVGHARERSASPLCTSDGVRSVRVGGRQGARPLCVCCFEDRAVSGRALAVRTESFQTFERSVCCIAREGGALGAGAGEALSERCTVGDLSREGV